MDHKTLEYMGERVDKARKLSNQIKDLQEKKNTLENQGTIMVAFIGKNDTRFRSEIYGDELIDEMVKITLDIIQDRINHLQNEFDKI